MTKTKPGSTGLRIRVKGDVSKETKKEIEEFADDYAIELLQSEDTAERMAGVIRCKILAAGHNPDKMVITGYQPGTVDSADIVVEEQFRPKITKTVVTGVETFTKLLYGSPNPLAGTIK